MTESDSRMIFGYGSLMEDESLRVTVPNARNVRPAYIKGFRREFSYLDPLGWKTNNLDLAGIPFCAVDVIELKNDDQKVNGVIFEVEKDYVVHLEQREQNYRLIETPIYDFYTDEQFGTSFVFSSNQRKGSYKFGETAQERYLEVCLRGARQHGDVFLREFLATTYIGNKTLDEMPDLLRDFG